jgi:capsular polysaccharide biosynthesis protein
LALYLLFFMNNQQFFALLRAKFWTMAMFGLLFSAASFLGLMVFVKPFQSATDFLVVQAGGQNQDYYAQFKSSEYLSKILSKAVYSERFIDAVIETGKVNREFLPLDKKERLKAWSKMVDVKKNLELGIITVSVKSHRERDTARVLSGITDVMIEKNSYFRGGDEKSVEVRVISGPINERRPTGVEILFAVLSGFAAGFLLTGFWFAMRAKNREVSLDDVLSMQEIKNFD